MVSLGEEMEVYFHSLGAMLETVLDWVEDPTFDAGTGPVADEMAAWRRHNPGVI